MSEITSQIVCHLGIWMACEYKKRYDGVIITCLGDIDTGCLTVPQKRFPLEEAVAHFFDAIPNGRLVSTMTRREGLPVDQWPGRRTLKRTLLEESKVGRCDDASANPLEMTE